MKIDSLYKHLMLVSANESNADDVAKMEVLRSYHQTFADAIRATDGRNTYCVLVIQGATELLWITYVTKQAKAHGVTPFWWDTGGALDRGN